MIAAHESPRRPRVLLLAYACSPRRGSEPGVGWNRAVQSARYFDTWVICEEREFAADIEGHLAEHGRPPGLEFVFIAKTAWEMFLRRTPGMKYAAYNLWHRRAFRAARRLHEQLRFDLVHQVNMCGFREPGYLWKLDAPFVWGPVGGTQNCPWRFLGQAGLRAGLSEGLRGVVNRLQLRFSPRVRRATRKATVLLAANSTNQRDLERAQGVRPEVMLETGLLRVGAAPRTPRAEGSPLRILWSGNLVGPKALGLLIKALARLPNHTAYQLRVLGDGPLRNRWQRLARRTGVEPNITWMGWVQHRQALRQYDWADVFVFTSLRDTSGNVVLEALGAGVPVVCPDHQGVRDMVTERCGIKIPVTRPREMVDGLRDALVSLARDPQLRRRLAEGSLRRARRYLWSRHGEQMAAVYRQVLNGCLHVAGSAGARETHAPGKPVAGMRIQ